MLVAAFCETGPMPIPSHPFEFPAALQAGSSRRIFHASKNN
jgi:hypothetical protein